MPGVQSTVPTKRDFLAQLSTKAGVRRGSELLARIGWQPMQPAIRDALALIVRGRNELRAIHAQHMQQQGAAVSQDAMTFAIDGRMVGDLGQLIAEQVFQITLCPQADIDAVLSDGTGRRVQVKATFLDSSLSFRHPDDLLIAVQLHDEGLYRVLFNGPARIAFEYLQRPKTAGAAGRRGAGARLEPIGLGTWALLDTLVQGGDRVPQRLRPEPRGDH